MIQDVKNGEPYTLTDRGEEIGTIVPLTDHRLVPPRKERNRDHPLTFPLHRIQTADSVGDLIDEMKGEW